ncbi:MAG: glutathione S-transferase C-terminal domain-containing protein, partial [Deltaproteobacteria bacterium]|nr:glutathione S-transferase C-terminal domain-containing protein [Deltaproteobacteria bacterium]
LVHVVEEILDEWFARTMVHYRWHYEQNTRAVVSMILGREVGAEEAREFPLAQWGPRACRATGTESLHQQQMAEEEYHALMEVLERQLGETPYVLGGRPTAVDAILLGGLRAHTNADPVPDLSGYPRVVKWDKENADLWDGSGELASFPESSSVARHILQVGRDQYAPFVLGNAAALAAGEKAFTIETYGEATSYLARPYPEQSRRFVQLRIRDQLEPEEQRTVLAWLETVGLQASFAP